MTTFDLKKFRAEYDSFNSAKQRCKNPRSKAYKNYGGRGIEFKFRSFSCFMKCLGPRPNGATLDRIDNDGHYEPGNVRWATWIEQANNRRNNYVNRVSPEQAEQIRFLKVAGVHNKDIARAYNESLACIETILNIHQESQNDCEFEIDEDQEELLDLFRDSRHRCRDIGV
jgi:hypothetical protein